MADFSDYFLLGFEIPGNGKVARIEIYSVQQNGRDVGYKIKLFDSGGKKTSEEQDFLMRPNHSAQA